MAYKAHSVTRRPLIRTIDHTDTGKSDKERLTLKVPAHGVAMLRIKPVSR